MANFSQAFLNKYKTTTVDKRVVKRQIMLGSDGLTNTGKTEFLLSAPGPKVIIAIDRAFGTALDNPNPPQSRVLSDAIIDVIQVPSLGTSQKADDYLPYFKQIRERIYAFCDELEPRAVCVDGDSDFWEIQLLAEFGRVSQIPPMAYQMVDGARRQVLNRCLDSGKHIIGTNKVKPLYEDVLDANGLPIKEKSGKNVQVRVEGQYKRQGHRDQDYLWQVQIRHLFKKTDDKVVMAGPLKGKVLAKGAVSWGIRIMKCKPNPLLEGDELWGDDCNFWGLVHHIYPSSSRQEWGFDR